LISRAQHGDTAVETEASISDASTRRYIMCRSIVSAQTEMTVTLTRDERRALAGLLRKITQQK
jgi:hypothetical protein